MRNPVVVDKRVAGIVRWLERLKNSYSEGAMEIALMDAECARADLEDLRQDVFIKCSGVKANPITKFFAPFFRVIFLAVLIVMLLVRPIARENLSAPVLIETPASNKVVLAEPIIIIRENQDKPAPVQPKRAARRQVNNKPQPAPERAAVKPAPTPAANKKVPYEQVLSLMQTGQRALKGSSTVIINNK